MQEILDMHDLNQNIYTQTHKLGNTLDWLISNTANTIQESQARTTYQTIASLNGNSKLAEKLAKRYKIKKILNQNQCGKLQH